ncbi:hypothetical protein TEA_029949 [Camellia sinensis var. sinensis]|uniref:FHA domain-containing protein n=1 Tax=Camellia sinensis var. sinensis TaxID=542762 RepID=A0A4S4EQN0_CAMSN|nr:hypothetical protein TEA_029949 [Camellia sinensis var. sinensis]
MIYFEWRWWIDGGLLRFRSVQIGFFRSVLSLRESCSFFTICRTYSIESVASRMTTDMGPPPPKNPIATTTSEEALSTEPLTKTLDEPSTSSAPAMGQSDSVQSQSNGHQDSLPIRPPDEPLQAENTTPNQSVDVKQDQQRPNVPVPYTIPEWSGPPRHKFFLEVLKEGSIIDQLDVRDKRRSVVDLWEDGWVLNGLRSPKVEEEKTKVGLERKGVAVRDLEYLMSIVAQATSRRVTSSLRLDRRVISALLTVSYDLGPWKGCIIGAAGVGDDGDGEGTSHGDGGGGGGDNGGNGGDGTSFGAGSEDFIGGFGLCDVGEHYDIGEPVAPLPQLPRRFRGSDTRRDERRIRSREQQLDSSDSSHSYPYHPYPSYNSDSQSYSYPPQQNYPWPPQQHGPPGYGLPNYQQAQQEYVDPFQPRYPFSLPMHKTERDDMMSTFTYIFPTGWGEVLQFKRNADAYLYDLGSTHGTFVNKNQVKKKVYVQLRVGDVIRFGHSSRLHIFQGPSELMPLLIVWLVLKESDLKKIRNAKMRDEMRDMEASLIRAKQGSVLC